MMLFQILHVISDDKIMTCLLTTYCCNPGHNLLLYIIMMSYHWYDIYDIYHISYLQYISYIIFTIYIIDMIFMIYIIHHIYNIYHWYNIYDIYHWYDIYDIYHWCDIYDIYHWYDIHVMTIHCLRKAWSRHMSTQKSKESRHHYNKMIDTIITILWLILWLQYCD